LRHSLKILYLFTFNPKYIYLLAQHYVKMSGRGRGYGDLPIRGSRGGSDRGRGGRGGDRGGRGRGGGGSEGPGR
jgi:hypothetical protein